MRNGDFAQATVAAFARGPHEQLQIHQVVHDDGVGPTAMIPRANEANVWVKPRGKRLRALQQDGAVGGILHQPQAVAVAAIQDEADVVAAAIIFDAIESLGVVRRGCQPLRVARELVEIPKRAGSESARPILRRNSLHLAFDKRAWDLRIVFNTL